MCDLIVSVPDHCLSFNFSYNHIWAIRLLFPSASFQVDVFFSGKTIFFNFLDNLHQISCVRKFTGQGPIIVIFI